MLSQDVSRIIFSIHVNKVSKDVLRINGELCNLSIQYFLMAQHRREITNRYIMGASKIDFKEYLRFMWNQRLSTKGKGNIQRELSQEKSFVYLAINEAFKSKFVLHLVLNST